jgi:hypothetical protein
MARPLTARQKATQAVRIARNRTSSASSAAGPLSPPAPRRRRRASDSEGIDNPVNSPVSNDTVPRRKSTTEAAVYARQLEQDDTIRAQ